MFYRHHAERRCQVKRYTIRWYRGLQADGSNPSASESGLTASNAYRKAVEAQTTPGCRLLGVTRDSDGCVVTVAQLRAWGRIGSKTKGGVK